MSGLRRVLSGADVVLPDRILTGGSLVVEGGRIVEIVPHAVPAAGGEVADLSGRIIVPGFIDVHVHGLEGIDSMDGPEAIAALSARMPRYGVTAFCPTTVACGPAGLGRVLAAVGEARVNRAPGAARVLPAHLESNFINPDYAGAQPVSCVRSARRGDSGAHSRAACGADFGADEILAAIDRAGPDVGIVTMASEIDGGLELVRDLAERGRLVSLGHSGASYDEALAAIEAGARQATHLFNRMPPLGHRDPGLAGAVLQSVDVAAEIVCDGYHVHPGMMRVAIASKGSDRVMAITDGSAGAGLPPGSRAALGGRPLTITDEAAFLDDNTLAGSTATMDRVFRVLTGLVGLSLVEAAILCATTPARGLGLQGHGLIAPGALADLVVLDQQLRVVATLVAGVECFRRDER